MNSAHDRRFAQMYGEEVGDSVAAIVAEDPGAPGTQNAAASEELERLRDPSVQYEILFPDVYRLKSEVFEERWTCHRGHVIVGEQQPRICPTCGAKDFTYEEHLEPRWLEMSLAFTLRDIHRRKVLEPIDHFATTVKANMLRHSPQASLEPTWLEAHQGYLEKGISDPVTLRVLRETIEAITQAPMAVIDGLTADALLVAAFALLRNRQKRIDDVKKGDRPSETTNPDPSASERSMPSSSETVTPNTRSRTNTPKKRQ